MPPNIIKTTTVQEETKTTKANVIKAWAPIVSAITALVTAIIVAVLSAPSSKLDNIVDRLDDKVIPKLSEKINELEVRLAELDIYRKVFEKEIDKLKSKGIFTKAAEPISVTILAAKAKLPKKEKFELPRVQMEQRMVDPSALAMEK